MGVDLTPYALDEKETRLLRFELNRRLFLWEYIRVMPPLPIYEWRRRCAQHGPGSKSKTNQPSASIHCTPYAWLGGHGPFGEKDAYDNRLVWVAAGELIDFFSKAEDVDNVFATTTGFTHLCQEKHPSRCIGISRCWNQFAKIIISTKTIRYDMVYLKTCVCG